MKKLRGQITKFVGGDVEKTSKPSDTTADGPENIDVPPDAQEIPVAVHLPSLSALPDTEKRKTSFSGFWSRSRSSNPGSPSDSGSPPSIVRWGSAPSSPNVAAIPSPPEDPVHFTISYSTSTVIPFAIPVTTTSTTTTPAILVINSSIKPLTPTASPASTQVFVPVLDEMVTSSLSPRSSDPSSCTVFASIASSGETAISAPRGVPHSSAPISPMSLPDLVVPSGASAQSVSDASHRPSSEKLEPPFESRHSDASPQISAVEANHTPGPAHDSSVASVTSTGPCLSFASFMEDPDEEQPKASAHPESMSRSLAPPSLYPTDKKAMTKEEEEKILRELRQSLSPLDNYPDDGGNHVHGKNCRPRRISCAAHVQVANLSPDQDLKARWDVVLSQYDLDMHEVMELLRVGMPTSVRPSAWDIFSGAKEMAESHPPTYYRQLIAVYESKGGSQSHKEIVKDIRRTLVDVPYFQTSQGLESLTRVLSAYCLRNPESVGYCQSINQIAGALLMVLEGNEEKAFWILVCMIENRLGYYCKSMCGLTVDQRVLNSLLKFNCPRLFKHLEAQQCSISDISVPWFMCLCVEAPVPIDMVPAFWDRLFLLGDSALFGLALALLALKEQEIMAIDEDLLMYFKGGARAPINQGVDWEALYNKITISEELVERIAQLRVFHRAEVVKAERIFNIGTAQKHAQQLKTTAEVVQTLWECFLEPTPWETLLQYCLTSVISFSQAFCCKVFSAEQRARWHEEGLFSGVIHRLFEMFDVYSHKKISFEEFLKGALVFMQGSNQERCDLAFRFFDVQNVGVVTSAELKTGFYKFHLMFNGNDGTAEQATSSFVDLILHKTANPVLENKDDSSRHKAEGSWGMGTGVISAVRGKRPSLDVGRRKALFVQPVELGGLVRGPNGDVGLDVATFSKYIAYHPFCQQFFGLGQPD